MIKKQIALWKKEEYTYPMAGTFLPNIVYYLHEDSVVRPAMLVVPGGGYVMVSPSEGDLVARRFYDAGFQTFSLTYTTNMFQLKPLEKQPLREISRAVRYIRGNADMLYVQPNQIACCGFSAGGHLVGSLAIHFGETSLASEPDAQISNRPDAVFKR